MKLKIKYRFSQLKSHWAYALILMVSLLTVFSNLGIHKEFIGIDSGTQYRGVEGVCRTGRFLWNSFVESGRPGNLNSITMIWNDSLCLLYKLGFPSQWTSHLLYFLFYLLSGLFMFSLAKNHIFTSNKRENNKTEVYALLIAFFYMFNKHTAYLGSFPINPFHISYMMLPLFIDKFMDLISLTKYTLKSYFALAIVTLILVTGNVANSILIALFSLSLVIIYWIIYRNIPIFNILLRLIKYAVLFTALSTYIWLPLLFIRSNNFSSYIPADDLASSVAINSKRTQLGKLFTLDGWVSFTDQQSFSYFQCIPILVIEAIFLITFASVLLNKSSSNEKKLFIFLLLEALFFMLLTKGRNRPFDNINNYLYFHLPYFGVYRAVYNKFGLLLTFISTFCFGLGLKVFATQKNKLAVAMFTLIVLVFTAPFIMGKVADKAFLVRIPQEYLALREIKDIQSILTYPPTLKGAGPLLNWNENGVYTGPGFINYLIGKTTVDSYFYLKPNAYEATSSAEVDDLLIRYLKSGGTHLLIYQDAFDKYDFKSGGDVYDTYYSQYLNLVNQSSVLKKNYALIKRTHNFDLYQAQASSSASWQDNRQLVIDLSMVINTQNIATNGSEIKINKINPSKITFEIKNSNPKVNTIKVILPKVYANGWLISSLENKIQVNGISFQNDEASFTISAFEPGKKYQISLTYFQQKYYVLGLTLSLFVFLFIAFLVIYSYFKRSRYVDNKN